MEIFNPKALAWYSFDFGASILIINGSLYFSQWVTVDNGFQDIWYSLAFICSTILLILVAPWFGVALDNSKHRKQTLVIYSALTVLMAVLIEVFGSFVSGRTARVALALAAFALLYFFYQLAVLVYNTYLKDITSEKNYGKVSGIGFGLDYLGSIAGLLITLPIIKGYHSIFGTGRIHVFIPAAIISIIVCLPMLFKKFPEPENTPGTEAETAPARAAAGKISYWQSMRAIWRDLFDTVRYPGVGKFLLGFYFLSDAALTLSLFAAIYLQKVLGVPDTIKIVIYGIVFAGVIGGAWLGGWFGDRFGNKKFMMFGVMLTGLAIVAVALSQTIPEYYVFFFLFGFGGGLALNNAKAMFAKMFPYHKKGQFFGMYSLTERFASIIGPIVWGLAVLLVSTTHAWNYRVAAICMAVLVFISAVIFWGIKEVVHPDLV